MGGQTWLLSALVALLWTYAPACGEERCGGFRHLENGRTFFRYGGLLVIFRCDPGYKLHGYQTNSCVSGHWSRQPPVCVGSGCPTPGPLVNGATSVSEDGSWAVFKCDRGFRLHGPSLLYCKGHAWNSSKPACKESDIMGSITHPAILKPKTQQNLQILQAPLLLKNYLRSHYNALANTASKEVYQRPNLLSIASSQTPNRVEIEGPNLKDGLKQHVLHPNAKVVLSKRVQFESQGGAFVPTASQDRMPNPGIVASSSAPLDGDIQAEAVLQRPSLAEGPMLPRASVVELAQARQLGSGGEEELTGGALLEPGQSLTESRDVTSVRRQPPRTQQIEASTVLHAVSSSPLLTSSVTPASLLCSTSSTSSSTASTSASTSARPSPISPPFSHPPAASSHSSNRSGTTASQSDITPSSHTLTPPDLRPYRTEYHDLVRNVIVTPPRRPVCPYPHVPVHGTFYFRNVENPGPEEYRHYIQYACYPGYTLAQGDVHSYCRQGGTWSGVTPVCLGLTPCSVNNGGCSQLCSQSQNQNYTHSNNQTLSRTQCHCRPGFILLDDKRTCRDVDECLLPLSVTGCLSGCVNTPGSYQCQCLPGYSLQAAGGHCQDIDECADNQGRGPCAEQCHNTAGFYRCSCRYGYVLAGDGRSCISQCAPGYRIHPRTPTPGNSTTHTLRGQCVDVDECQEREFQLSRCEGRCVNLPGSHLCICPRGYILHTDGWRCKDVNECDRRNGGCSHQCVNHRGGYRCVCPASHRLSSSSRKTCEPRKPLVTADRLDGLLHT